MDTRALIIICTAFLSVVIVAAVWIGGAVAVGSVKHLLRADRAIEACEGIVDVVEYSACLVDRTS